MNKWMKEIEMKKYFLIGLLIIGIIGAEIGGDYFRTIKHYKETVSKAVVESINLQSIKDGVYIGEYDANVIAAKVSVEVENGKIIGVTLLQHKQERGEPAEVLTSEVVKQQSLDVDTITGATNSSKVILKAIENALNKGK